MSYTQYCMGQNRSYSHLPTTEGVTKRTRSNFCGVTMRVCCCVCLVSCVWTDSPTVLRSVVPRPRRARCRWLSLGRWDHDQPRPRAFRPFRRPSASHRNTYESSLFASLCVKFTCTYLSIATAHSSDGKPAGHLHTEVRTPHAFTTVLPY